MLIVKWLNCWMILFFFRNGTMQQTHFSWANTFFVVVLFKESSQSTITNSDKGFTHENIENMRIFYFSLTFAIFFFLISQSLSFFNFLSIKFLWHWKWLKVKENLRKLSKKEMKLDRSVSSCVDQPDFEFRERKKFSFTSRRKSS